MEIYGNLISRLGNANAYMTECVFSVVGTLILFLIDAYLMSFLRSVRTVHFIVSVLTVFPLKCRDYSNL